jgi:hypothetical protein
MRHNVQAALARQRIAADFCAAVGAMGASWHLPAESRMLHAMGMDDPLEDFQNFTHSVSAARVLMARAYENGSLVEGLVLYASVVDALLRMLVAHSTAEQEGTIKRLDLRYVRHDESLWMNERKVYRAARECGVLSESEFNELEELYRFRNIVIHRFIISGVAYDQIGAKLDRYEAIYWRVLARLEAIEQASPPLSEEEIQRYEHGSRRSWVTAAPPRTARREGRPGSVAPAYA